MWRRFTCNSLDGCLRSAIYLGPLIFCLAACAASSAPLPTRLRLEATDLAMPLLYDLAYAYAAVRPDVVITVEVAPWPRLAADLAAGRADLVLAATAVPNQFATPVAYVEFVVIAHRANPIESLQLEQVREIFAGRMTEWDQVGGPPRMIQVVSREPGADGAAAFQAGFLGGASPTSLALVAPDWAAMREAVAGEQASVGYVPVAELEATVKAVYTGESRPVLIAAYAPAEPLGAARDFLLWVQSAAGQAVVEQRYRRIGE